MNKITEFIVGKALAQGTTGGVTGGSNDAVTNNSFDISDFTFLKPFDNSTTFPDLLGKIIGLTLTLAALAAFFYLLIAGFQYITAGGDAGKATAARTGIVNALIGIIVILVAYVILRYVGTGLLGSGTATP